MLSRKSFLLQLDMQAAKIVVLGMPDCTNANYKRRMLGGEGVSDQKQRSCCVRLLPRYQRLFFTAAALLYNLSH